ncbi:hypothetical protein [Parasitella parasitica]|uniref:RNA-directed DNA polymerase n=1 Tax=Parasitella parasitica TaxID=35722 RepID=A0A0B7NN30_9FUNG|nr:hypothetical protein [Parasitella parasitica]
MINDTIIQKDLDFVLTAGLIDTKLPLYRALVNGVVCSVLIDSGASANYISPHLLSAVTQLRCVNGQAVETANGHQSVISSIATFSLQLGGYKDDMEAYVFQTKFDLILGNSWLRQVQPTPDWFRSSWSIKLSNGRSTLIMPIQKEMKSKSRLNNHDHDLESRVDAEAANAIGINGDAVMIGSARDREMVDDGVTYMRSGDNIDGSGANAGVEEEVDVGPGGIVEVDDCDFVISARQFERLLKKGQVEECFLVSSRGLCDLLDLNNMDNVGLSDQDKENEIWCAEFAKAYPSLFKGSLDTLPPVRHTDGEMIELEPGTKPVSRAPCRMSPLELKELKRQLDDLLAKGFIEPCVSEWGSPVLFVKKPNGSLRMVCDYRALNAKTIAQRVPLPRIDECLEQLHGVTFMSSIDLKNSFWQQRLTPSDSLKSAINTRYGQFSWSVMAMGLKNSGARWMFLMNDVLKEYIDDFVICYIDDCLIYTKGNDIELHKQHLHLVFKKLEEAGLVVSQAKCKFNRKEITFLGHDIVAEYLNYNNAWKPVASISKNLSNAERNYHTKERELLAILFACRTRRYFVEGSAYEVFTDYRPLQYYKSSSKVSPRLVRWIQDLEMYQQLTLVYKKGVNNIVPDLLSRREGPDCEPDLLSMEPEFLFAISLSRLAYIFCVANKSDLIEDFHRGFGHSGQLTVYHLMKQRVWWPSRTENQVHHAPMKPLEVPAPFARWHIDFIGELPTTSNGNRWILMAVDYATNWPIARALKSATADEIVKFIYEEIVMKFGSPVEIVSDRGANLLSKILKQYMHKIRSKHMFTSAFHPRTNSKCERLNQTFKHMLTKYVKGLIHSWDDYIDSALFSCRIRKHATTGYSPFYLVYGQEPVLPGDSRRPFMDPLKEEDPELIAEDSATADEIVKFIYEEIVMKFGCPVEIVSDRGANLLSKILKQYMHKIRSKHMFTSAFHPRTNSKCERLNQTFKHMLTKYVKGLIHSWDDYIDSALFSCRIRKHATTGYSPFYLVYGQEPVLPGDSRRPFMDPLTEEDPELIAEDVLARIRDLKEKRFEAQEQMILQARKDNKERWDAMVKNNKTQTFTVGDYVMLRHESKRGLEFNWMGPYVVLKTNLDYNIYQIQEIEGKVSNSWVHTDRLHSVQYDGSKPDKSWYIPRVARAK